MTIAENIQKTATEFEEVFGKLFEFEDDDLSPVSDAMKYSALSGGKRIRPFILVSVCKMFGGKRSIALKLAAALECIHTYSLIHDDLPCMDNDDLRRGKPTCHKAYGEEFALLAGDALLTYAFELISAIDELSPEARVESVRTLSSLAGIRGMVGGQTLDLKSEGKPISLEKLHKLQALKTGALMKAAAALGAIAAGASDSARSNAEKYAEGIGLAFQITDDILDVTSDEQTLGKPIGSDAENQKITFLSFMSIDEAHEYAKKITENACGVIRSYPGSETLTALAEYLLTRIK